MVTWICRMGNRIWFILLLLLIVVVLSACGGTVQAVTKTNPADGKVMVQIPAGPFQMGMSAAEQAALADNGGLARSAPRDESPTVTLDLPVFYIDQTPVTNAEYKRYLDAHPDHPVPYVDDILVRGYDWDKTTRTYPAQQDQEPVVLVTWPDAESYCAWAGMRLPTEAEWEKAARGTDGRIWPWGNQWDSLKISQGEPNFARLPSVGQTTSASPFGVFDMVGLVWQWTSSLDKPYPYRGADGREDASASGHRITRGGAYGFTSAVIRTTTRNPVDPSTASLSIGFRCATSGN